MVAWLTPAQVRDRVTVPAEVDDAALERALGFASFVLAGLSGVRPQTKSEVVPVPCGCGTVVTGPWSTVDLGAAGRSGPSPFYWRTGPDLVLADGSCGCELVLPEALVVSVDSVVVDGTTVPAGSYELVDAARLRRLSGPSWPAGRTRITYTTGGGLPDAALAAATSLAVELAKSEQGLPCALPSRVTSITRQGVTAAAIDPQTFLTDGRTGLYLVDLFLASVRRRPRRTVAVLIPGATRFETRRSTP